jgi:DNA-binding response OmpR family regulator
MAAKDALTPPQTDEDEHSQDPWNIALSVRGAEKMLERYAQKSADGITTFTKKPIILVIDDELALLTVLSNTLKRAGYDVYSAINGQRGIEQAQKNPPDLIICDIMMPSPNGFKVREYLSENPITANIPFIFLSARTAKGDIVFALKSGGDDYITKPFDRGELLARVEAVLRRAS